MEQIKTSTSRLFVTTAVENKDEFEERFERAYAVLQGIVSGLSEKEAHDALNNAVCKDKTHEDVSLGLLVTILTEPENAAKSYRDLTLITRDGLASVLTHLSTLILERFLRFTDTARNQLIWLVREMIRNAVTNIDNICWNLMRHASGGDITPRNVILTESLLDIYMEHRSWLDKFPVLICSVVYTYLRLIEDHNIPQLHGLRQKEVAFVVSLIRERFSDVLTLGRDLVRLLQNVARLPEFNQLWQDILMNPKTLCPTFMNILQLLQTRTSRRFLQSRLTPDMEKKLVFLTSQVRFGNHKRYQEWFQRQYLATPESQSLRSDMIRFIVGVIHPTNELLCSDIIPRWAVIGWLLTTCTSSVAASNSKLALFYDWLFYDPEKDNIMNIEPAILVMHHSMRSHPAVTATLLDFLCRIIPNFYPALSEKVKQGIFNSLRQIIEKRVLPNLYPLFDSPKLDRELRTMVREMFKEFCIVNDATPASRPDDIIGVSEIPESRLMDEPAFSDDEEEAPTVNTAVITEDDTDDDDVPLSEMRLKERPPAEELANALPVSMRIYAEKLLSEKPAGARASATMLLLESAKEAGATLTALSDLLAAALQDSPTPRLNRSPTITELNELTIGPIFSMFKYLSPNGRDADHKQQLVLDLFKEITVQNAFQSIGYLLLLYLKVAYLNDQRDESDAVKKRNVKFKTSIYKDYVTHLDLKLTDSLSEDLKVCQECDNNTFAWLIPDVFREFKDLLQNHVGVLHTVVSSVDARQLQDLVCHTLQGTLLMFKPQDILTVLTESLHWETFEQYCLWQLLTAHDMSVDDVLPILPKLEFKNHAEALTSILLMLKQERPTAEAVRQLLCRDVNTDGDVFVVSTFMYWCQDYEEKLGDLVSTLLSTRYPGTSPNKRKRPGKHSISPHAPPSAYQILGHLDHMRIYCFQQNDMFFYNLEPMQKALQQAQSNSTDNIKKQFSELFALAWEEEPPLSRRGRKPAAPPPRSVSSLHSVGSSNDDSEEEEIVKPKQAKRRKKAISDSD